MIPAAISSFAAVLGTREDAGRSFHGQAGKWLCRDVANGEVDMTDVALHGQCRYLLNIAGIQHDTRKTLKCSSANSDSSDVLDIVAIAHDKRGACAHRDDNGMIEVALIAGS